MTNQRTRIVEVATEMLRSGGPAAVTTRGVADAAGLQAPTIYRLFGDKEGLLDAVAEHVLSVMVASKATAVDDAAQRGLDPLEDLRAGWAAQIAFGLDNPSLFALLSDPDRGRRSAAVRAGQQVLAGRVRRLAAAGRLRVAESRVVDMIRAAGTGAVIALLATPPEERDPQLPDAMLEAVLGQVLNDEPDVRGDGPVPAAVALRAVAGQLDALTVGERALLAEWLDRVVAAADG